MKFKIKTKHPVFDFTLTIGLVIVLAVLLIINAATGTPLKQTTPSDNATTTAVPINNNDTPFKLGKQTVHLYGNPIKEGDVINTNYMLDEPTATIDKEKTVNLNSTDNKWRVIETVPSLDSPVCSLQTKILGVYAEKSKNVEFITISQDLPFAQNRYINAQHLKNLHVYSDYRGSFSHDNHLLIKETKLNARVIMVVDPNNKVKYIQYAHDEVSPLDLDKAMKAIKNNQ